MVLIFHYFVTFVIKYVFHPKTHLSFLLPRSPIPLTNHLSNHISLPPINSLTLFPTTLQVLSRPLLYLSFLSSSIFVLLSEPQLFFKSIFHFFRSVFVPQHPLRMLSISSFCFKQNGNTKNRKGNKNGNVHLFML